MVSAFLLCATFEVMGLCEGFGAYLYSRRLTPCGRGLMAPPGLTALGAKGSVRDRLTPYRPVEGSRPRKVYSTAALARWAPLHYRRRPLMKKTLQPPCGRGKCIPPLVAGATTLPCGKHVTGFAGRLQLPYGSSSFATPASGGTTTNAYCRAAYEENDSRCFILPPA